jgi:hypothetical protein
MSKKSKREQEPDLVVVYARLHPSDHAELKRREETTGAPIAAQIRILVHDGLRKKVLR